MTNTHGLLLLSFLLKKMVTKFCLVEMIAQLTSNSQISPKAYACIIEFFAQICNFLIERLAL